MKTLLVVLALLLAFSTLSYSQGEGTITKFYVPLAGTAVDTVPGTHTGGAAGAAGWLFIGMAQDVNYSITCIDSQQYTVIVDYADTGYASATGTSANDVGFKSYLALGISTDSVNSVANVANPKNFMSRVLRQAGGTDNIPNGLWIRFKITRIAGAASTASNTVRLTVALRRYAQN